jgi:hypothetical protein
MGHGSIEQHTPQPLHGWSKSGLAGAAWWRWITSYMLDHYRFVTPVEHLKRQGLICHLWLASYRHRRLLNEYFEINSTGR